MRQITKTVYTFGELIEARKRNEVTERAVDKARKWMLEGLQSFDWYDCTFETWQSALAQIGFENADIRFSGFWSQGDGASFTSRVDLDKLKAFMAEDIQPSEVIDGVPEDFRPWLVHNIKGKSPANKRYLRIPPDYVSASVERTSNHYSHENTCRFSVDFSAGKCARLEKLVNSFEVDVEHLRRDLCRAIYRDLEEEYEYQTSDESYIDSSDANDYTFDKNGRRDG